MQKIKRQKTLQKLRSELLHHLIAVEKIPIKKVRSSFYKKPYWMSPVNTTTLGYSEYIVYVDESGDHSLKSIDENYPVFVLTFCVFRKKYYSDVVTPAIRRLKFATFGHDMVILHEQDIRKKTGAFSLLGKEKRESFLEELNVLISKTDFTLIASVIDKYKLKKQDIKDTHAYHLAMRLGLEKLHSFLCIHEQENHFTYVVCEARGATEDRALELEFRRVCDGHNAFQKALPFDIVIADKKTNSEGLQFADLAARPVGISVLRPDQPNRALRILEKKFHKNREGETVGHGLHVYP